MCRLLQKTHGFIILVWFSEGIVTMNRIEKRDIIPLRAIRFRPMQELKMDDFPGGCTNPLKCHGTLSCTSLNKSYFYPGVRSHYLHALLRLPKLLELALLLKTLSTVLGENLPFNWALIINPLRIYKCTVLVEQQHTSMSGLPSRNAFRNVLSSSSFWWKWKDRQHSAILQVRSLCH